MKRFVDEALRRRARLIRQYPTEQITTVSPREEPAEAGGLAREDVEAIWDAVVTCYRGGLYPGMALSMRRRGRLILDRTIGHERGNAPDDAADAPKVLATPDTWFNLFSASKIVTAMLIHQLDDEGLLHLDDAVAEYIPEFARRGKQHINIRHVLTHRAGIPVVPWEDVDLDMLTQPARIVEYLCDAKPASVAGRRLAYHALTGGYLLGEIIERVTGKPLQQVLDEKIREPLGLQTFTYGVPEAQRARVAHLAIPGPRARPPSSWLLKRAFGVTHEECVEFSNDPRYITGVVPSGNVISTAEETGRFLECLLRDGEYNGRQVFQRRTVHRAVAEQNAYELDMVLMMPLRYGMGFMLGGEHASLFGKGTPRAYGHLGFTTVVAWADPERDISVSFMNTGKPFVTLKLLKWMAVMNTISERVPRLRL